VVLFWNPTCGFCQRMLDDLKAWEENPPQDAPKLLVVSTGTLEANRAQGLRSPLVIDDGFATGKAVGASGTPAAVLIDREGHIAGAVAVGAPRVFAMLNGEELVEETPGAPPIELTIGDPAPPIELPDLDGNMVSLTDVATVPTVVLFWSPGCVFCQRMVEDLKAWEEEPPENAPRLLVISRGDLDANRAAGLQAPILIDSEFGVGQSYGASGTPSAVLVDGEGKVASKLKVGAGNVLKLTGYVSKVCQECLDSCVQQGGGTACQTVCEMGGQC
jgi:thiol-disulfide isomerase/thioredoxin